MNHARPLGSQSNHPTVQALHSYLVLVFLVVFNMSHLDSNATARVAAGISTVRQVNRPTASHFGDVLAAVQRCGSTVAIRAAWWSEQNKNTETEAKTGPTSWVGLGLKSFNFDELWHICGQWHRDLSTNDMFMTS